jgi:GNAT superfamily N-acetyltransferase
MLPRPHSIRRGRRTDFIAVMEILALSELPVPPPDRATLRRFRHVVADLGSDFYVATIDERLVGVVHATYARQIATYPVARIELLVVAPDARRQEVGRSMVHHIATRARKRSCVRLSCDLTALKNGQRAGALAFFAHERWSVSGALAATVLAGLPDSAA